MAKKMITLSLVALMTARVFAATDINNVAISATTVKTDSVEATETKELKKAVEQIVDAAKEMKDKGYSDSQIAGVMAKTIESNLATGTHASRDTKRLIVVAILAAACGSVITYMACRYFIEPTKAAVGDTVNVKEKTPAQVEEDKKPQETAKNNTTGASASNLSNATGLPKDVTIKENKEPEKQPVVK